MFWMDPADLSVLARVITMLPSPSDVRRTFLFFDSFSRNYRRRERFFLHRTVTVTLLSHALAQTGQQDPSRTLLEQLITTCSRRQLAMTPPRGFTSIHSPHL